ncbi:MAG: DUF6152 family protein [Acidobacteriota bacterium]
MSKLVPLFLALAASLSAHHSIDAVYSRAAEADYKVTVTKVTWMNPHAKFTATQDLPNGTKVTWSFELAAVNRLFNDGWTRDTLKPGDTITVNAFPAKDGSFKGSVVRIVWPDGRTKENNDHWDMVRFPGTIKLGTSK